MIKDIRKVSKADMIAWFEDHDFLISSLLSFANMQEANRKREEAEALADQAYKLRSQALEYMDRAAKAESINSRLKLSEKASALLKQARQIDNQESKLWV